MSSYGVVAVTSIHSLNIAHNRSALLAIAQDSIYDTSAVYTKTFTS